jgi:hypothetical protein
MHGYRRGWTLDPLKSTVHERVRHPSIDHTRITRPTNANIVQNKVQISHRLYVLQ